MELDKGLLIAKCYVALCEIDYELRAWADQLGLREVPRGDVPIEV